MMSSSSLSKLLLAVTVCIQMCGAARRVDLGSNLLRRSAHFRNIGPKHMLGLREGEDLKPGSKIRTAKGTVKVKMQETYLGLAVVGEAVVLEFDDADHYTGRISGQLLEGIQEDIPSTHPAISPEEALEVSLAYSKDDPDLIDFDADKDAVLQIEVEGREDVRPRLVYQLNYRIETHTILKRPTFTIDANTGRVLKSWNGMTMATWRNKAKRSLNTLPAYELVEGVGGNMKTGKYLFGLDLPALKVTLGEDGRCVLENQYALVYNCKESYTCDLKTMKPHHFDCKEGNNDTVNDGFSSLNDALFYVGITYEMYSQWYEQSDILKNKDINGGRCPTRVHFGMAFENAFWDGKMITFGDGADRMYPLASLNVVAHEISHGFTEKNSGLIYAGESGGMNEAFSDMAGEAAEEYLKHKIDWMVGFGIWKVKNESMRYFDSPPKDGHSIEKYDDFCFTMDPHSSSGVYNKVFYTLSRRPGWCVRKAFRVFVVANNLYWKPNSDMHSGACDVQRAADDLGFSVNDVTIAFREAGVEPCTKRYSNHFAQQLMLNNESSVTFKLSNLDDDDLNYNELFIMYYSKQPITLVVQTMSFTYTMVPREDALGEYGESNQVVLNLKQECFNSDCNITASTHVENIVVLVPFVLLKTIIAGIDVQGNAEELTESPESYEGRNSTDNDTPLPPYTVSFEIDKMLLEKKMRILLVGKSQSRSENSYFIRHALPPNLESSEYDGQGTLTGAPLMLCKPQTGTYYLTIAQAYQRAESVSVKLGVLMMGEQEPELESSERSD